MPVFPFRSLRFRLIASVVVIEVVMLSLLVWSNLGVIRQAYADLLNDTAANMLQQVARTSGGHLVEVDYATLQEFLEHIAAHEELTYLSVLDRDQRPVVTLGTLPRQRWPVPDAHPSVVQDGILDVADDIFIGDQFMGQVRMGFSLASMNQAIDTARIRSIAIATTEIALTILATVLIGVHLTRRLGKLATAAQRVGAGDYNVSVAAEIDDEVGTTARAFNYMVAEVSERTGKLQESLARERVIEETSIDGMITYGTDCLINSVNPAMQELFGYAEKELITQPASLLLCSRADAGLWLRSSGSRIEVTGVRKDHNEFPLELYIGQVDIAGELLFAATLHDITERKQSENECRTLLEGNRFLIHKSLAVQEEERRHLARELHDELGQCLTAIQADAEIIHDLSKKEKQVAIETSAGAILSVSSRIYDVVHSMMQRLRPGTLDDLGLVAALDEEINAWRARHLEIHCTFETGPEVTELGEAINITLYRIVQEALTNIAKHAGADEVSICLGKEGNGKELLVIISDNGRGMSPALLPGRGLGLIGMRERVEALNGHFDIHSEAGSGTTIRLRIPLLNEPQEVVV